MERRRPIIMAALLVLVIVPGAIAADVPGTARLTPAWTDSVAGAFDIKAIGPLWKYQAGDNPEWARPDFDDSSWPLANPTLAADSMPASGWPGIGWFRLHLAVDSSLVGVPLSFQLAHLGAVEMYLNGQLIRAAGKVGRSAAEEEIRLDDQLSPRVLVIKDTLNVIAVRLSNHRVDLFHIRGLPAGFALELARADQRLPVLSRILTYVKAHQWFFTGSASVLGLVFLLIYFFSRRQSEDLYFALLATGCALISYWPFELHSGVSPAHLIVADFMFKLGLIAVSVFGLRFLYELFYLKLPRQYWVFLAGGLACLGLAWIVSVEIIYIFTMISILEMLRVVVLAATRRRRGAGVIVTGYTLFGLGCTHQMLIEWEILPRPVEFFLFPYMAGILALLISMSVHLARQFARTNAELSEQLAQVRELSDKSLRQEREAREQEIARKLLQKDNEHQRQQLEEAKKLERALSDLETAHSQLQQAQTQLVQSEKMASLGTLVAGIAHEINTPVGAISSMHDTLIRAIARLRTILDSCTLKAEETAGMKPMLATIDDANRVIESGTERVITIVRRLRSFARLDEAELKEVDIHEGIEDTLTLIHHEIKNRITVVKDYGDIPPVTCYPGRLNQVFLNLLNNGRQAIEGEGTITITTLLRDGQVEIRFEDSGKGIGPDDLAKVFDPGFTTKGVGVGTGLGLSICYQIIKDHQGELTVRSEPGKGSVFTILLPLDLNSRINSGTGDGH